MIKKLKSKIFRKGSRVLDVLVLAFFVLAGIVSPGVVKAQSTSEPQEYNASQIAVDSEILINGKADNFVRVGQDGSFEVKMKITLVRPDQLVLGRDKIIFPSATTRNKTVIDFGMTGAGFEGVQAGDACKDESHTGLGFVGSVTYRKCDGPIHSQPTSYSILTLNSGQSREVTFRVDSSKFTGSDGLGINNVKSATSNGINQIVVWPALWFDMALRADDFITFEQAAQNIYIELYPTQVEADQHQNDPRPSTVPAYSGAVTGSARDLGSGGSGLLGLVNQLIGIILGALTEIIYQIFSLLISPLIEAVLSINTYTDTFAAVIYPGWELVRNVSNIFFIVALIVIGLATLLRLSNYQFKHLLVQLIIAALLVNFSLVIGQAVLAIADTVQQQFLPNSSDAIKNLGHHLMVSYRSTIYDGFFDLNSKGYFANTIQPLFFLALSLGSFLVFLAIGMFLVIRIVMLWILLMVSPIAYVAGVLPATTQYRKQWWSTFLKYAFFTPIMAFFLSMAAYIASTYNKIPILQQVLKDPNILGTDSSVAAFVFKVSSNVMLLVFLIVALKVSESFGIYGASFISGFAKKGMFAPFALTGKAAKAVGGYVVEAASEKARIQLNPMKWVEGWQKSRELNRQARLRRTQLKAEGLSGWRGVAANPAAFFQRYWDLGNLWKAARGSHKKGVEYMKQADKLEEEIKGFNVAAEVAEKAGDTVLAKKKRGEAEKRLIQMKKFEELGWKLMYPDDYLTQQESRIGVNEEKNKIHAETWQELVSLSRGALAEKKIDRFLAIFQKLAETYNENELITHSKYTKNFKGRDGKMHRAGTNFADSVDGYYDFSKLILEEQLGMSEEAATRFVGDIFDIGEHKGHLNNMRGVDKKRGRSRFKPLEDLTNEVTAEKGKMSPSRKIGEFNRLAHVTETPALDYDISEIRVPDLVQSSINDFITMQEKLRFAANRGDITTSTARVLAYTPNLYRLWEAGKKLDDTKKKVMKDYRNNQIKLTWKDASGKPVVKDTFTDREQWEYTLQQVKSFGDTKWKPGEMQNYEKRHLGLIQADQLKDGLVAELRDSGYIDASGNRTGELLPHFSIPPEALVSFGSDSSRSESSERREPPTTRP